MAHVRAGAVVDRDGALAAEVLIGRQEVVGHEVDVGRVDAGFRTCDDPQLRVMCFGWLALAWSFQHTIDDSD